MALGAILGPKLGPKLGAKLGPSWDENSKNGDSKTMSKNELCKTSAGVCGCTQAGRVGSPIINQSNTPRTTPWALEHSPRAQGPVADICIIYVKIYLHI